MPADNEFKLEREDLAEFLEALLDAYTVQRFGQMLMLRLGRQLSDYSSQSDDRRSAFFNVIVQSGMEGWTKDLIVAALEQNPRNPKLQRFAQRIGLNPVPTDETASLEKVVQERSTFQDIEVFLAALGQRVNWICKIVVPNGGGTGVLVGPGLVLTNFHVVETVTAGTVAPTNVSVLFDFKKLRNGLQISPGRRVAMHADWHVASRPYSLEDLKPDGAAPADDALDYAVLKLASPVGNEPLGVDAAADALSPKRGWLTLSSSPPLVAVADPLILLQHPMLEGKAQQEPIQLSVGKVLDLPFGGRRVRHDARTLGGSSGSPCFDANLAMVALHHSGDPISRWQKPRWNAAIPLQRIVDDLAARGGIADFWSESPPDSN